MNLPALHDPWRRCWLALLGLTALGCSSSPAPPTTDSTARPAIQLRLLVVDDPQMAAAIGELGSEWKARTGVAIAVEPMSIADLLAADSLKTGTDAIIYPSRQLGPLAERKWIAPLPPDYATNRELAWPDTFELLQLAESRWGQVPYAIPFGSPVLTCYYRTDLFERFHRRPPQSWSEYHELAQFFHDRKHAPEALSSDASSSDAPWSGTVEPLAAPWAARVLLARAAAYAKHRDHFSTLFKIDTMEPLIAGPAFVRALEELAEDAKLAPAHARQLDPAAARREFLLGHSALALSWPSGAGASADTAIEKPVPLGFVELPGSEKVYNIAVGAWESRAAQASSHVTTLGIAGRLGSIGEQSFHPLEALQLLAWLSGQEWGSKVSSASAATTLYRHSQMRSPQPWLDRATDGEAAKQYAVAVKDALSRPVYLLALGIPGQEQYLAALDTAIAQVLSGEKSAEAALKDTADAWRKITAERGLESQRVAYRKSLGLDPD